MNVEIINSKGEKLKGILHKADSNRLVIVCHGFNCTKETAFIPQLCNELAKNGFNAFRFDFAGNRESEGRFEDATISKEIKDIKSVSDYFSNDYEVFCLIGHSKGAVEVLLNQAKYKTARNVVDIAGVVNQEQQTSTKYSGQQIKELKVKGYFTYNGLKISKEYYDDRLGYGDIRKEVKKIKVPVLVVHGTEDDDVPFENGKLMAEALRCDFKIIKGADHFFRKYEKKLITSIIDFLRHSFK
ncbi:alpha/beta hydrolase [Candidatus Woesearchaeota archaeon]|nr:alpha/beta hydrolase [Candidatus Woesearchaeota archaeon]